MIQGPVASPMPRAVARNIRKCILHARRCDREEDIQKSVSCWWGNCGRRSRGECLPMYEKRLGDYIWSGRYSEYCG